MKKYGTKNLFLLLLFIPFLLVSCVPQDAGSLQPGSKTYDVSNFEELVISNDLNVTVSQGVDYSVEVKGDQRNIRDLKVYTTGKTLFCRFGNSLSHQHETYVNITMPTLVHAEFSGASKAEISGFNDDSKDVKISVSGASKANVKMAAATMRLEISGASKIKLSSHAKILRAEASGASSLDAYDFSADSVYVEASGASSARVNALQYLNAHASGASNVHYRGNPTITQDISGASSIHQD